MCGISLTSEFTPTSSVLPSRGASDSSLTASTPPAPGLGSTITVCPVCLLSTSASTRATMSAEPPAGPAATMRTGLAGQAAWARASGADRAKVAADASALVRSRP